MNEQEETEGTSTMQDASDAFKRRSGTLTGIGVGGAGGALVGAATGGYLGVLLTRLAGGSKSSQTLAGVGGGLIGGLGGADIGATLGKRIGAYMDSKTASLAEPEADSSDDGADGEDNDLGLDTPIEVEGPAGRSTITARDIYDLVYGPESTARVARALNPNSPALRKLMAQYRGSR